MRIIRSLGLLMALLSIQGCTHLLFYPSRVQVITPATLNINYDDLFIPSTDGTQLHGWWMHSDLEPRATILFFHGNGENISTHIGHVYWLLNYGYDVIAMDYRGYGQSQGEANLDGSIRDVQSSLRYVLDKHINGNRPLLVLGQSMGGSLVIPALAQSDLKNRVAAVVVIGSFSDFHRITQDALSRFWLTWLFQWPLSFTVDNHYSPQDFIAQLSPVPVLIMHGKSDPVVPVEHAQVLYDHARQPKYLQLLDGDHNHILAPRENRQILLEYLDRILGDKSGANETAIQP